VSSLQLFNLFLDHIVRQALKNINDLQYTVNGKLPIQRLRGNELFELVQILL
jgi:hypothetical protein